MSIKLVIFDLDGTLVDSLADLTAAVNHMLAAHSRPTLSSEEVRLLVGQGARRLVERALPGASEDEIVEGLGRFLAYNDTHIADSTRPYPGVMEVLSGLAGRGVKLAVVSNKNEALCRKLLEVLGMEELFVAVLGADSVRERKPSPEPILKLLRDFDVSPADAVMVGDSINDIEAGQGAGVMTVGCSFGYGNELELAGANFRIDAFADLLTLPFFRGKNG